MTILDFVARMVLLVALALSLVAAWSSQRAAIRAFRLLETASQQRDEAIRLAKFACDQRDEAVAKAGKR